MSDLDKISAEIKNMGEGMQEKKKDWELFKSENNARLENLEKGRGVAELSEKVDKINDAITASQKSADETAAAVARMHEGSESFKSEKGAEESKALGEGMRLWLKAGLPESFEGLGLDEVQKKALQSNINPQGGYTVNPHFGGIEKRLFDTSPIRSLATVQTIGTDEYVGYYDDNEFGAGWIGEIDSRSDTATADIGEFRIPVREMYARFKMSSRVLEDSSWNLESWSSAHVADKFARLEATSFVNGSTPLQPQGLMTATAKTSNAGVYTRGQIGTKVTAGANDITTDEIIDTRALLKPGYRGNANWLYNRNTEAYIRKLVDGDGNYIWQPSFQMGEPDMLIGQRTSIFEDMADIATGAKAVALADVRATYLIVDRLGMATLKDIFTAAVTGQVVYMMKKRTGGAIKNWDAMKYIEQT